MREKIRFPCGCRTIIEKDDFEFSYCDEHSVEKLKQRISGLELKLKKGKIKLEEAEKAGKAVKNEADFEYFKLLEKHNELKRKQKNQESMEGRVS